MPFQVSPGVNVSEIDLSTVVPAVSSTEGAFAGVFRWFISLPLCLLSPVRHASGEAGEWWLWSFWGEIPVMVAQHGPVCG